MLLKTITELSKIIDITDEQKQSLLKRYQNMPDREVIKELSKLAYQLLRDDTNLYNKSLDIIRNINKDICPPVKDMKKLLENMYQNSKEGNISLEANHELISHALVYFTNLFNQYGIDYYIVGAIPCFIRLGIPFFRYHDDIDIMINEKDISKVSEIIKDSDYLFQDDRFPSVSRYYELMKNKPPHTVLAKNRENEFHLGFFIFRREEDASMTLLEYSHSIENGNVVVDILEKRFDILGTVSRYDDHPISYLNTTFKTATIESVYNLKHYTKRPKDITDMQILQPYINEEKLALIKKHSNIDTIKKNVINSEITKSKRTSD